MMAAVVKDPALKATTISTIAVQTGLTRIVLAVLKVDHLIFAQYHSCIGVNGVMQLNIQAR